MGDKSILIHVRSSGESLAVEISIYSHGEGKLLERKSVPLEEGVKELVAGGTRITPGLEDLEMDIVLDNAEGIIERRGSSIIVR